MLLQRLRVVILVSAISLTLLSSKCKTETPTTDSAEASYAHMKGLVDYLKVASTLPAGDQRSTLMNAFIKEDQLGALCKETSDFLKLYQPSNPRYQTVQQLNSIVVRLRAGDPCEARPMTAFDAQEYARRLSPTAAFLREANALNLP